MRRVILIHGWQGQPGNHWKVWFRKELEGRGIEVLEPRMPNESNKPEDWILKLRETIGKPDTDTVLVGHSLGCPTIIGYLMTLERGEKVRGVVLVAGFSSRLPDYSVLDAFDFDPKLVSETKENCDKFVSIMSDDDTDVPNEKTIELNNLVSGELIIEHNKGHFCGDDGVVELPSALDAVLKIFG